jgi:hypothetical protein
METRFKKTMPGAIPFHELPAGSCFVYASETQNGKNINNTTDLKAKLDEPIETAYCKTVTAINLSNMRAYCASHDTMVFPVTRTRTDVEY